MPSVSRLPACRSGGGGETSFRAAAAPMLRRFWGGREEAWRAWRDSPFRWASNQAAADADHTLWHVGSIVLLVLLAVKTAARERLWGEPVYSFKPQGSMLGAVQLLCLGARLVCLLCATLHSRPANTSLPLAPLAPCYSGGVAQCHAPAGAAGACTDDPVQQIYVCALPRAVGAGGNCAFGVGLPGPR